MSTRRAEPTDDGHHVVVDGRRWRATDPSIPEPLRAELVSALMAARRAVKDDGERGSAARAAVHDAKVALGERGEEWWEETTAEGRVDRLVRAARSLLQARGEGAEVTVAELASLSKEAGTTTDDARAAVGALTDDPTADAVGPAALDD